MKLSRIAFPILLSLTSSSAVFVVKHFEHLGPYRIGRTLGQGGMGTVFEGTVYASRGESDATGVDRDVLDPANRPQPAAHAPGQRVAVKVLSPQFASADGFRERFEAEIESLKQLRHDNIVRLYGYGQQDGVMFYSMELVDGPSLEDEINAGRRFDWREVTQIGIAICKALKHAHDRGVIHRDLKPANLLMADGQQVKLSDFGIARLFGSVQLTQASGLLGTAEFMSPEQADGSPVTDRCDQYSLGEVLFTLLAARPPFQASTLPEMLQMQRFAHAEPVSTFAPDTPQELERIIIKLMDKNPAKRYPNAAVVGRQLEAMLHALTRSVESDFHVKTGDEPNPIVPPISLAETIDGTAVGARIDQDDRSPSDDSAANGFGVEGVSLTGSEASQPADGTSSLVQPSLGKDHFITVEEESRQAQLRERPVAWLSLLQIVCLLASLAIVVLGVFYFSRPPSADALYATITSAAESRSDEQLGRAESEMRRFLDRFSDDPRAGQVEEYLETVELARLDRNLRNRVLRRNSAGEITPLERLYVEAMDDAQQNPQRAIERLRAIIDLYSGDAAPDDAVDGVVDNDTERRRRCLKLAKRHLNRLAAEFDEHVAQQRAELEKQFQRSLETQTIDPQRAKTMFRAIVELYADQSWAADIVTRARQQAADAGRESLKSTPVNSPTTESSTQ